MFHVQYFFHQFCQLRGRWYFSNPIHVAAQRQASFVMSELSKSTEGFQVLFEDMPEDPWSWCQRYGWRILGSVPAVCVRLRQLNELYKLYGYTQKTWTRSQTSCEEIPRFLLASCHLHDRVSTCLTSQSTQKSRLKLSNRQIIALCEIGHGFILAPKQSLDPPRATHLLKSAGPTSIWGPKFCPCRCHWKPEAWHFPGLHLPGSGSMAWGHSGSQCYPLALELHHDPRRRRSSVVCKYAKEAQAEARSEGTGRNWKELEQVIRNDSVGQFGLGFCLCHFLMIFWQFGISRFWKVDDWGAHALLQIVTVHGGEVLSPRPCPGPLSAKLVSQKKGKGYMSFNGCWSLRHHTMI